MAKAQKTKKAVKLVPRELFAQHCHELLPLLFQEGYESTATADQKKALKRYAFESVAQPAGPFELTTDDELETLIYEWLRANDNEATSRAKTKTGSSAADSAYLSNLRVEVALETARSLHTHYVKYMDSSGTGAFIQAPGAEKTPYLSSRTALDMRYLSANLTKKPLSPYSKLYLASLRVNGELSTVAAMVGADIPAARRAFYRAGATQGEYERIVAAFKAAFDSQNKGGLPGAALQLLWPVEPGADVALTPLPALAVYNALTEMSRLSWEWFNAEAGSRPLDMTGFKVGGTQPQNASMAASSMAGRFPLLCCVPPAVRIRPNDALIRKGLTSGKDGPTALLNSVLKADLGSFGTNISRLSNRSAARFLQKHAFRHAAMTFEHVLELRQMASTGLLSERELSRGDSVLARAARGEPLDASDLAELGRLATSGAVGEALAAYSEAHSKAYYQHLQAAIKTLMEQNNG